MCLNNFKQTLEMVSLESLILCNSFFIVQSSVFLPLDWKCCFSQWVFMSSCANHKESLPVLSFPQWQWESWPRAWALTPTITYVSLHPVINDCIRLGHKDILCNKFYRHTDDETFAQHQSVQRNSRVSSCVRLWFGLNANIMNICTGFYPNPSNRFPIIYRE